MNKKLKLSDLPKELQEVIYIEDCHISGTHDPIHTIKYICKDQLVDLAKRILKVISIDLNKKGFREMNKIPRKLVRKNHLTKYSWYQYYVDTPQYICKAKELENWEKYGFIKRRLLK